VVIQSIVRRIERAVSAAMVLLVIVGFRRAKWASKSVAGGA